MFKPYDASQFDSLPDFELARKIRSRILRQAQLCGQVLCRYGCQQMLAVSLLHKHFDLAPNERLVRTYDDRKRAQAAPVTTEAAADALPWIWRFCEGASGSGWYPVEYVQASPAGRGLHTVLQHCVHVFSELAQVLLQNEIESVFGVAALYADEGFLIGTHEQIVESSNASLRRLDLNVSPRDSCERDATVTQYRWSDTSTHQQSEN